MAKIAISALATGTPKGTDLTPATDTTDTSQAPSGTTKKYIRSDELNFYIGALGVSSYTAVISASTGALTATYANGTLGVGATLTNAGAQAAFALDGVTAALNDRVLIKNQAAPAQNGIYTVTTLGTASTNWVLTRATDMDQAAEVIQYKVVFIDQGSTNANTTWQISDAGPYVIGTTAINYNLYTLQSGLTFPLALNLGGTAAALTASNGGVVFSNASTMQILSGTATAGQMLRSGANAVGSWSTATWPSTTTINQILYSSANNVVGGISSSAGALLATDNSSVPQMLANPAATGKLLSSVSGNLPAWSTATFPTTAGSAGTILRSDGTNWVNSTSTFADTYTASTLLYSNGANTVTGLATANSAILRTNSSGVPAWSSSMTNGQLLIGSTGATPATATLTAGTGISITNGAGTISVGSTAFTQIAIQSFTASGTYTPTSGMKYCVIQCIGGGGGGGGVATTTGSQISPAGGGGGGEYTTSVFAAASIGVSQVITIGAGGAGGAAGANNGTGGGTSSVGSLITAVGGSGGATGGLVTTQATAAGGAGGTGGTGQHIIRGQDGQAGYGFFSAQAATASGGNGGSPAVYGMGANGGFAIGLSSANAGNAAAGRGAGGSGGFNTFSATQQAGGAGSAGFIIITEYI